MEGVPGVQEGPIDVKGRTESTNMFPFKVTEGTKMPSRFASISVGCLAMNCPCLSFPSSKDLHKENSLQKLLEGALHQ